MNEGLNMDTNKSFAMSFAEFAEAVSPTGAVNRFPAIGPAPDVYSYSVYMNGPLAATLPVQVQEHTFKDVTLHALTEKLQLNSASARDNLKVAELVAMRSAWMSTVLEASIGQGVQSGQVLEDYTLLTNGMTHPWIVAELNKQRELSSKLWPSLARAGVTKDVIPQETSIGVVLAQDSDFTIQKTHEGEVVTHENRRLNSIPEVGADIMVTYYRGTGQVVDTLEKLTVSPAFIDPFSEDLAVVLNEGQPGTQVILFNSMGSFDKFVKAHGLDESMVQKAMDVRAASPKTSAQLPPRKLVKPPYVDLNSGCLAIDYEEHDVVYSALFGSAKTMASLSKEFDLGAKAIGMAHALEADMAKPGAFASLVNRAEMESEDKLRKGLKYQGYESIEKSGVDGRQYMGKIVAASKLYVAQDIGRRVVVIHDTRTLDKSPAVGDRLTVKFKDGRGQVTDMVKAGKDLGR